MIGWRYGKFSLSWYTARCGEKRGLVWSDYPVYCAASVFIYDGLYSINTSGWVGLPEEANKSLVDYMENFVKTAQF